MAFDWTGLGVSVTQFLEVFRIVRICPDKIDAPNEQISLNVATLASVLLIFALARHIVAGADAGVAVSFIGTIVSAAVMFVTGFVILVRDSRSDAMVRVRKWGMFFVLTWIISLIAAILIDGIAVWSGVYPPPTSMVIDQIFLPGSLPPLLKDSFRALIMGVIALGILLVKTYFSDSKFKVWSRCSIGTILIGLLVNTALLILFLYSNAV